MDWIKVTVYTSFEGIEPVCGNLYQLGLTGVEIEDEADFKEFLEENKQYWDYVDEELIRQKHKETSVSVYVSDNLYGHEMLAEIKNTLLRLKEYDKEGLFGRLEMEMGNISEEDWANNWKKYFHPIKVGKKILIRPEWEAAADDEGRIVFSVNPGMTFGTGSHYTTRLCIEEEEKYINEDVSVLDIGCGSGILSIIALMLGAKHAVAVDIDPNCIKVYDENAQRNGVPRDRYEVFSGDVITDKKTQEKILKNKYPVILANIVADVIIAALPVVKSAAEEKGIFIASGIIEDRIADCVSALSENGFEIVEIKREKDWAAIVSRCP